MAGAVSTESLSAGEVAATLLRLAPRDPLYATQFVEQLLTAALERRVSDVHLTPQPSALEVRWRVDGVLESLGSFPSGEVTDIVTRLKVLADLLTYRQETPQEGRLRGIASAEMRLSTFPTLHGERAVIRIFSDARAWNSVAELGLPEDLALSLHHKLAETSGAVFITGPAGSGKTTTVYACLRTLLEQGPARSLVSLEDPIECVLPGVAQAALQPTAGFDYATALRSLMRQDPEVILVGEVRDRETAIAAFQAALTGHLVFTTFHAGSCCAAISRLNDMGIESYVLRSGLQMLLGQRLVRRLCSCAVAAPTGSDSLGLEVTQSWLPQGCPACARTGYRGRLLIAEQLPALTGELGSAVLASADAHRLQDLAQQRGMQTLAQRAITAIEQGSTSAAEVRRVLGFGDAFRRGDA